MRKFEDILKTAQNIGLSIRERVSIENNLRVFMSEHPAQMPLGMRARSSISAIWDRLGSRSAMAGFQPFAMAFVLVMVVGIGTSYAAGSALPGDILYPVKIYLNEPIEGAFAVSQESQAQWNTSLVDKRLQEAEKLVVLGRLTPQNENIIQAQLNTVTKNFDANVDVLAATPESEPAVADAQSNLEASFAAHAQVLSALASSTPESQAIKPILANVRAHVALSRSARIAAEDAVSDNSTTSVLAAATTQKVAAESKLKTVRALLSTDGTALNASTTAQITSDASDTQQTIQTGDQNLAAGQYNDAFKAFQAAIRTAQETTVGADAQANLGNSIELPALSTSDATSTTQDSTSTVGM